jgi:hypothetical protein
MLAFFEPLNFLRAQNSFKAYFNLGGKLFCDGKIVFGQEENVLVFDRNINKINQIFLILAFLAGVVGDDFFASETLACLTTFQHF